MTDTDYVLDVQDLKTYFYTFRGVVKAVDGVSFKLKRGGILGVVGESGCGKSVTGFSLMKMVDPPGKFSSTGKTSWRKMKRKWRRSGEIRFP